MTDKGVIVPVAIWLIISLSISAASNSVRLQDQIESLDNLPLDNARSIEIRDTVFHLPYATVKLYGGSLYFFDDNSLPAGIAFYSGEGSLTCAPQNITEAQQFKKFYGDENPVIKFDNAYFAFPAGSGFLKNKFQGGKADNLSGRLKTEINRYRKIPDNEFKYNLSFHLLKSQSEGQYDFLYGDFGRGRYHHTVYVRDPYSREQISIYKIDPEFKSPQTVSSISIEDSLPSVSPYEQYDLFRYDIDAGISTYSKSDLICTMSLKVLTDRLKFVSLTLPTRYTIDSVTGDAAGYYKKKDRPELLLEFSDYFFRNDTISIQVYYRTNLFYHFPEYGVVQKKLMKWYPYHGFRQLSYYKNTYTIDDGFNFISVGRKISDSLLGSKRTLRFESERPIAYVTFNYGLFDSVVISDQKPRITLFFLEKRHSAKLFEHPIVSKVANDIARSFAFFNRTFSTYSYDRLDVAAMSVSFGQGSPGLVHLSEVTFEHDRRGVDDKFRAHEVAHQWWGHIVNPMTYHDAWMSEGMAEYSAALYIQLEKKDSESFRDILERWHKDIVQSGRLHGKKSIGYKAGAIILGERLGSEISPGDYEAIVYYKAAYMLHMLRFEITNVTDDENKFLELLASFAKKYSGRGASTDDFIDEVRPYLGERTESFFNQWMYDWRIPNIEKDYRSNGNSIDILINVKEVDASFMTPYPVEVKLKDDRYISRIYEIRQGENSFEIPIPKDSEVETVDFNTNHQILEK